MEYAAGAAVVAGAAYLLIPGKYQREPYKAPEATFLPKYAKGDKMYECRPDGQAQIKYAEQGVASQKFGTMVDLFKLCVKNNGSKVALKIEENNHTPTVGPWKCITWNEYYDTSSRFAKALLATGFEKNRSISICAFNTPEWLFSHMGVIMAGGKSAGVYTTNTPDACQYIAEHSESRIVVCDTLKNMQKFLEGRDKIPLLKHIVVFQDAVTPELTAETGGIVISWKDFLALGTAISDADLEARIQTIKPNEGAVLIYTSGTTGNPKACVVSHDAMQYQAAATTASIALTPRFLAEEHVISYLPLSHIAGQLFDVIASITCSSNADSNCTVWFARPDVLKGSLGTTLKMARPTMFLGVPRVWEKFVEGIKEKAKNGPPLTGLKLKLVNWAKDVGLRAALAQQIDGNGVVPRGYGIANKVLFSKVRDALGLDRSRFNVTGAAPITKETLSFLASLGILVYEGYGMSETTGGATLGGPRNFKWGSCGQRIPGMEVEVFHDPSRDKPGEGEICFRGRNVMMGYMKGEEKTREAIDPEGWMHSGDVGRFDSNGLLFITGRIKELIIGAGGENIAPVPIEDEIKRLLPAVSNVVVIGDKRKYNVVLLTLKCKPDFSTGGFTDDLTNEALTVNPAIKTVSAALSDKVWNDYVKKGVETYNASSACVSNACKVQYFKLLPTDLSIPGGELTPTMKLKRNVINEKYAQIIDSMYKD
jgi:long-chain-fatty-acid--CoA ligase ACSBG